MKTRLILALGATGFALTPGIALAQATPAPAATAQAGGGVSVGATIYDTAGGVVGTVESVASGAAVVSTGTTKVNLPLTSFGTSPKGPTLALTRAQLEAEAAKASAQSTAQLDTLLVAGTAVYGQGGQTQLGTVKSSDAQFVTVAANGRDVRLPRTGFAASNGRLLIGMTAADFQAAVGGATAGTGAAPATGATTPAPGAAPGASTGTPATTAPTPSTGTTGTGTAPGTTGVATPPGAATTTTTTPPRN